MNSLLSFAAVRRLAACLVAVACLMPAAARADSTPVKTSMAEARGTPVLLEGCWAWSTPDIGTYRLGEAVTFTNHAVEPVVAIRFRYDLTNAFGESLGTEYGTVEGFFSANTRIEGNRMGETLFYPVPSAVRCSVDTVKFRSGTIWHAGDAPVAMVTSATAAAGGHPATCKVTLADKSRIEIPWDNPGCEAARRAYAAQAPRPHPATCKVALADKSQIDIPWTNPGCAAARAAWGDTSATSTAPTYDYDGRKVDGHPVVCVVAGAEQPWASEPCAPARAQWAAEPAFMHAHQWDDHDAAPENLVDGHPKYCDPFTSGIFKGIHYVWSQPICKNARAKWEAIHGPPETTGS